MTRECEDGLSEVREQEAEKRGEPQGDKAKLGRRSSSK